MDGDLLQSVFSSLPQHLSHLFLLPKAPPCFRWVAVSYLCLANLSKWLMSQYGSEIWIRKTMVFSLDGKRTTAIRFTDHILVWILRNKSRFLSEECSGCEEKWDRIKPPSKLHPVATKIFLILQSLFSKEPSECQRFESGPQWELRSG